jgi:hypothetical protein
MTYTIAKEFKIINDPKDCIQHFIDVLEQYK